MGKGLVVEFKEDVSLADISVGLHEQELVLAMDAHKNLQRE